jgi:flagellar hook-associated protein 2
VRKLFIDSGVSSNALIEFVSAGAEAIETTGGYSVDITQAASQMILQGAAITDPADAPIVLTTANNILRLTVDGVVSGEMALSAATYSSGSALATEIQGKIKADPNIGARGVTVEWVDNGATGYLKFTSGSSGSGAKIAIDTTASTVRTILGLADGMTEVAGKDVAGTINGEAATGAGRFLTGNADNPTTAGLRVEARLADSDLVSGAEATLTWARGFAARLDRAVDAISRSVDGSIARRTKGIQTQIDDLRDQIADQEERLAARRERLFKRFTDLETALSRFQTQSSFLEQQLSQLSANTRFITS